MKGNKGQMGPAPAAPSTLPGLQLAQPGQGVFLSSSQSWQGADISSQSPRQVLPSSSSPTALPPPLPAQNSQVRDEKQTP